jgi:hypothetical protein
MFITDSEKVILRDVFRKQDVCIAIKKYLVTSLALSNINISPQEIILLFDSLDKVAKDTESAKPITKFN